MTVVPFATRQPDATAALRAGWHVDADGWFVREMRGSDIDFNGSHPHFGFTYAGEVYVRNAAYALAYDRGEIVPQEEQR